MPERRHNRGQPTPDRHTPDLERGYDDVPKPAFGTHRICTACKGKGTKGGQSCRTCRGTGYELIVPLRRAPDVDKGGR